MSDVKFKDYEKDTRELAETAAAVIEELKRDVRNREVLIWAMVRAAGGSILVSDHHVAVGYPEEFSIDENASENGRRFTIRR